MTAAPTMFDRICSWDNLLLAYRKAAKGKRARACVAAFDYRLEEHLVFLRTQLRSMQYRPGAYASFLIHDPKRRLISAAPFLDRVVHHALCNVIEPVLERTFISDSYANRMGKGTHKALDRGQSFARKFPYVLQCDLRQFFPSIDHAMLYQILAKKFKEEGVLWLIRAILTGGDGLLAEAYDMVYFPGDDLFARFRERGLPIGNLTSQFWANCYLNPFDHFVKRQLRCKAYLRYVDDFLLFSDSKQQLWNWKRQVDWFLQRLRLTMHDGAHPRPVTEGMPFLGFVVYPDRRRLRRRNAVNFSRRFRGLLDGYFDGTVASHRLNASAQGWVAHARHGNTVQLREAVLADLRSRWKERASKDGIT